MYKFWCRKGLLIMGLLLLANCLVAQKNHLTVSMNGIGLQNYSLKEGELNSLQLETGFFIYPGGEILYSRDISDSFTLHTGIAYQFNQYLTEPTNIYYRYGELSVPVINSIHILKKSHTIIDWSLGIYFNQLLHMDWFQESSGIWYDEHHWANSKNPTKFGMDFYSDLKLKYPLYNGKEIFIAPFWKYHLIKKDYYEGITSHSLGLKIGYTFKSY